MIMLSPDLGVLADGVEEGRRTFANILKYVRMGTSSNFGNMLSMALASLVLPFLPLLPVQILLNNLLYDLSEIGIPFDRVDEQDLSRPQAWDMGGLLRFTLIMGALSSVFDLATFAILIRVFDASPELFQTAWFVESTATQILVIFIIRTRAVLDKPGQPAARDQLARSARGRVAAVADAIRPLVRVCPARRTVLRRLRRWWSPILPPPRRSNIWRWRAGPTASGCMAAAIRIAIARIETGR